MPYQEELDKTMAERMTPQRELGDETDPHAELDVGYAMSNGHTHTKLTADIIIVGADTDTPAYLGCFPREVDESPDSLEARWNAFAEAMWRFGVEPVQDDPWYTEVKDGVVYDHYPLKEVACPCEDGCHD